MGHMLPSQDESRTQSVTHSFFIKEILQLLPAVLPVHTSVSGIRVGPPMLRVDSILYTKDISF